ncbi:Eukaryotic translation initiation factor 4 gamma 3 [Bagarius yarrelli]|uniref:Eukaryotic translation initiation factor 4 gamma 3 n=1 Tax=Bagarius yarrelli TaxID=175774 RepID=A0A556VX65_BAGYA|nr:Eukaryotic translation initiation factor 4 gamma 3 [Bagarius yarrelli]
MFRRRKTVKKRPGSVALSKTYPRCELEESKLFLKQFLMLKVNGEIPESINISVMRDWLIRREMNAFKKRYKKILEKLEKKVIQEVQKEHLLQLQIKTKGGRKDQQTPAPVITETLSVVARYSPASAVKITPPPVVLKTVVEKETGDSESVVRETVLEYSSPAATLTSQSVVMETPSPVTPVCVPAKTTKQPSLPAHAERREDTPPPQTFTPDSIMQGTSVSMSNKKKKWKKRLKDLNRKETGDPPPPKPEATPSDPVAPPPVKEKEIQLEKEDKPNKENVPSPAPATHADDNQYNEKQWKPTNLEERKIYDREFLLGLQFISASKCKPEGLPHIRGVVLDKNVLPGMSVNGDIHLHKAVNPWCRGEKAESDGTIQKLLQSVQAVLNKMTPQMFQTLMKQIEKMRIDTEEKLKGLINLVFEKAVTEPNFSFIYANMCYCLMGLKVSTCHKPDATVNFRKLLLNLCQKEFERDKYDGETFKKREMELDSATNEEVHQRLIEELEEEKDTARRRRLGNIKFIGELFKAKVLKENIIHDCVVKLLKNQDEENLESLCILLSTIGKDLDIEKARNNWVSRQDHQGPKTIEQIHKDAEMEQQRERMTAQQQLFSVKLSAQDTNNHTHTLNGALPGDSGAPPADSEDNGWYHHGVALQVSPTLTPILYLSNRKYTTVSVLTHREVSKPLLPIGKAGELLAHILTLLSKTMVNLDKQLVSSGCFVGALMRAVCCAALTDETPVKVDSTEISQRAELLQRYIKDQQMELQALDALHSIIVEIKQPPSKCVCIECVRALNNQWVWPNIKMIDIYSSMSTKYEFQVEL